MTNIMIIYSIKMFPFARLFQKAHQLCWHPVASPLLIGLSLPQLCYEKRYIEIPVLITMPVAYNGFMLGIECLKMRNDGFHETMQRYSDEHTYRIHERKDT
jgi:hypothetical protein